MFPFAVRIINIKAVTNTICTTSNLTLYYALICSESKETSIWKTIEHAQKWDFVNYGVFSKLLVLAPMGPLRYAIKLWFISRKRPVTLHIIWYSKPCVLYQKWFQTSQEKLQQWANLCSWRKTTPIFLFRMRLRRRMSETVGEMTCIRTEDSVVMQR